jgi:hypothetical protein
VADNGFCFLNPQMVVGTRGEEPLRKHLNRFGLLKNNRTTVKNQRLKTKSGDTADFRDSNLHSGSLALKI